MSELNVSLFFYDNVIGVNGVTYKRCTAPMKFASKINVNVSSYWLKDGIFWNEELLDSKNVMVDRS